jgi:hypothetical protein
VAALPAPVRRWFDRCVGAGVPASDRMELTMEGSIRLGRWVPFRARQVLLGPVGMVWAARAGVGPLWLGGFDRVVDGRGEMRWRLLDALPVIRATGDDVDRSAAGRLAGELLLNPTAATAPWVSWRAVDDDVAVATVHLGSVDHDVALRIGDDGLVRSATLRRWGSPAGRAFGEHDFHVVQEGAFDAGGIVVARTVTAGWNWDGTGDPSGAGPFYRATVTSARIG